MQKTETKLKGVDRDGNLIKQELPVFDMPTTIKKIKFKPEGRILAVDIVPVVEKKQGVLDSIAVPLDKNDPKKTTEIDVIGKTESGLLIVDSIQKDMNAKGLVLAVGDLVTGYEVGDIIIYKPIPQSTMMIEVGGEKFLAMEQYNVIGKYIQ